MGAYPLGEAAKTLTCPHPDVADRLFCLIGLKTVEDGKSKSYRSAIANLKRAKKCYERAGIVDEWNRLVDDIRDHRRRKTSFMPKFEKLLRGAPEGKKPSFLDAAKKNWTNQPQRARR